MLRRGRRSVRLELHSATHMTVHVPKPTLSGPPRPNGRRPPALLARPAQDDRTTYRAVLLPRAAAVPLLLRVLYESEYRGT